MGKMKLDYSKNGMLVGEKLHMENLCETCVYRGVGVCPSARHIEGQDWHDFPQIIDAANTAGIIKVFKCREYTIKPKLKKTDEARTKRILKKHN